MSKQAAEAFNPLGALIDVTGFLYRSFFAKKPPIDVLVKQVIDGYGIENKWESVPELIRQRPLEDGMELVFSLPPGKTSRDFEAYRLAIEQQTNTIVEIQSGGPVVILSLYKSNFPSMIPYDFSPEDYPHMLAPLPIGVSPTGKLVVVDMAEVYHMLIGGVTGYGKTSELLGITVALLLARVPGGRHRQEGYRLSPPRGLYRSGYDRSRS